MTVSFISTILPAKRDHRLYLILTTQSSENPVNMDALPARIIRNHLRNQRIDVAVAVHGPYGSRPQDNNTFLAESAVHNFKYFSRMFLVCRCLCGEDEPGFELVERLLAERDREQETRNQEL